jgi:hypothetical protein
MPNGYEAIYETLIPRLVECDFAEAAGRLGFELLPTGNMAIDFLGRKYEIGLDGVTPADGKPVNVNNRSVLIYYALSQGRGEPAYAFSLLHHFAGGLGTGDTSWMTASLVREFGGDYEKFCLAARKLGLVFEGTTRSGDSIWSYALLPKIPIRLLYCEADDEFPCEVKIMFDNSASRFLEFEPLAFLCGCFVRALTMTGKTGSPRGWE